MPGCHKLAGALRDQRLIDRLDAWDAGFVVPPRYRPEWDGKTVRNGAAIAAYTRRLAERVQRLIKEEWFPVVLGGDCSILLANMLALRRLGRHGLVFLDAHLDFRHPGNSPAVGAAAGEDLALVTGRGAPELVDIDALAPYVRDEDVAALGFRPEDEWIGEAEAAGMTLVDARELRQAGRAAAADAVGSLAVDAFWIHVDADVLDAELMPAVDSPEPGGLTFELLGETLAALTGDERARGLELTLFDPDLDPDGTLAQKLAAVLVDALALRERP